MAVPRRSRLLIGSGVVALAVALGAGAAVAPQASSAPRSVSRPVTAPPAAPSSSSALVGAAPRAAVAPVTAAVVRVPARLVLTVKRGRTVAAVGVLSRASTGAALRGRAVKVYVRTGDTGRWHLAATRKTSARGRIEYDLLDRPLLQFTLRFEGDRSFRPAASVMIVPDPSATRMAPALVTALAKARAAARRAGLTLVVNSGYRSWTKQQQMFDAAVRRYGSVKAARRWVLPPGESTHVRGLAADIGTPATAAWLTVHGAAFGLCRAYGDEPWHFEYRPDWIKAYGGRCPPTVPKPGDPGPLSPAPRVPVI